MRDTVFPIYLANTVLLMVSVAALSAVIGVLTAWLTVHYDFPLRRILVPALALPLAAPAYVIGYVYADLLEFSGPIQIALRDWLELSPQAVVLPNIRSLPGAALVISLVLYPMFTCSREAALFSNRARCMKQRALGAGPVRVSGVSPCPLHGLQSLADSPSC